MNYSEKGKKFLKQQQQKILNFLQKQGCTNIKFDIDFIYFSQFLCEFTSATGQAYYSYMELDSPFGTAFSEDNKFRYYKNLGKDTYTKSLRYWVYIYDIEKMIIE